MALYNDLKNKFNKPKENDDTQATAVSAWFENIARNSNAGQTAKTIPTIRNRLQYREESSASILSMENLKNTREVVQKNIAQVMYGELKTDDAAYNRILDEYQKMGDKPASFFKRVSKFLGGKSGTQDPLCQDYKKASGEDLSVSSILNRTKTYLKNAFSPADGETKSAYEKAIDGLSESDLSDIPGKLASILANSAPGEFVKDVTGVASSAVGLATSIVKAATSLNPDVIANAYDHAIISIDEARKGRIFNWISNVLTGEDLIDSGYAEGNCFNIESLRHSIMCMPPGLGNVIDPQGRAYTNNVLATQHIMTIVPGYYNYSGIAFAHNYGILKTAVESEVNSFVNGNAQTLVFDNTSITKQLFDLLDKKSHRLADFAPKVGQYLRIYNTLMARFVARLSPMSTTAVGITDYSDDGKELTKKLKTTGWGGIQFALGSNTTISETASNSFGQGIAEQMAEAAEGVKNKAAETFKGVFGSDKTFFLTPQTTHTNFPKHWENSSFSKSYTISFRLECPYGNTDYLMSFVYKPFCALLALALPVFETENSFTSPFVVRVDCPGFFSIDTGIITSLDIRRAVDENSWSANGMATAIEVTMSVMDLYEALSLPVGPVSFNKNYPMQTYIDNIAGMNYKEIYSGGSMISSVRTYLAYWKSVPDVYKSTISAAANKFAWGLPGSLWGSGRNR